MTTTKFFRALGEPQATAIRRIQQWRNFSSPHLPHARADLAIARNAEEDTRRPRRKVLKAFATAIAEIDQLTAQTQRAA